MSASMLLFLNALMPPIAKMTHYFTVSIGINPKNMLGT